MATTNISYDTTNRANLTITAWNSLDAGAYAASDYYDNTTFLAVDAAVYGRITIDASPGLDVGDVISFYLIAVYNDGTDDIHDGDVDDLMQTDADTSSALTEGTDFFIENAKLAYSYTVGVDGAGSETYDYVIPSVVAVLGGMPMKFKVLVHNGAGTSGEAFNSSGNTCTVLPIEYTSA